MSGSCAAALTGVDRNVPNRSRLGARFVGEEARHQRVNLLVRQCCQTHEPCVETLEFGLAERVQIDPRRFGYGPGSPHPTQQDLSGATVGDRALAQASLDVRV